MNNHSREREFRAIQSIRYLVSFRVLNATGPQYDVVSRVIDEVNDLLREQSLSDETSCIIMLGGNEDNEQKLQVFLRKIISLCVAILKELQRVTAVLLLELSNKSRGSIAGA